MEELSLAHNPWAALTGEIQPTITFEKRGRGRPRKHNLPQIVGKSSHKLGDSETKMVRLTNNDRMLMVEQFKELYRDFSVREALRVIASRFEITYEKAFTELSPHF